ncbi:hypothetical protein J4H92_11075 [Leucobacter weissii]|uniref:Uncharacterized protein n=1 Tax=Leucobacter weissii TaxID=1983706 RepID=A0A939MK70_9MICO|nr:hypothetical protein [Leucobacter weissii]MBO1902489.1 hypothetical protein [Leucobacter weissii]
MSRTLSALLFLVLSIALLPLAVVYIAAVTVLELAHRVRIRHRTPRGHTA